MAITFNEYVETASRTAAKHDNELVNYAMGLSGESGELIDLVKKFIFHGHHIETAKIKKEGGDVLWYASQLVKLLEIKFNTDDIFDSLNKQLPRMKKLSEKHTDNYLMICCLNLSKASGKISEIVDQLVFNGADPDVLRLKREMSTIFYNLFFIITIAGLTIEEVAEGNIEKLKKRYPDGFDVEKSINRVED